MRVSAPRVRRKRTVWPCSRPRRNPGAESLGYDRSALLELPEQSTAAFAGVANPHRMGPIGEGKVVVDIGCGAGMDLLLAAKSVGPSGRAIGIDMTDTMIEKALSSARSAGFDHVEVRLGDAMSLPLADDSVDVVISNGVLNLEQIQRSSVAKLVESHDRVLSW